jgi:hypothetical protein
MFQYAWLFMLFFNNFNFKLDLSETIFKIILVFIRISQCIQNLAVTCYKIVFYNF